MSTTAVVIVVVLLLAAAALAARQFARGFLRPGGRRSSKTPETFGFDGEPFTVRTDAGAIRGWFIRAARERRPTVLLVHGWQSHAGDMLSWLSPIIASGYHAVVYDTLGHGHSDPSEFTSIRHFLDDVRAVLTHAGALPDVETGLVLMGHSMGGAAALIAASEDASIRGVIAAAAPTDAIEITREWLDARGLPGRLLIAIMQPFWKPIVKGPYAQLRPVTRIAEIQAPILILHGSADKQVPVTHAARLGAQNRNVQIEVLDGADHLTLPKHERYAAVISSFLNRLATPRR